MDKRIKIVINRAKIATKEILCECEETLETMKEVIYARGYSMTEKLNEKSKKITETKRNNKKGNKWTERRSANTYWLNKIRGVKVTSGILNRMKKKIKWKHLTIWHHWKRL